MSATASSIPARLDRLPWSAWHWRVVIALGVSWLLDGLEVTVVGSIGPALQRPETLGLSASQIGWAASAYIGGAVLGALYFGRLADKLGRKRMFLVTLVVYLIATLMTALSWDIYSFAFCRVLTGFGIGGEYAAINSAIDELIPARLRGRVDLAINGTFWIGAAMGAGSSIVLLNPEFIDPALGWRIAFALGGVLAFAVLLVRRVLPESPRWLMMHGRFDEAEAVMQRIEKELGVTDKVDLHLAIRPLRSVPWSQVIHVLTVQYRARAVFSLTLMASQAFFYNAIFFTYALVLARFYGVPADRVGYYIFPFALGNFLGPLLLGHLFDTVGRRFMIAATYALSGVGLLATGYAFQQELLTATTQALAWSAIFFVASAAASSAYLTVSEVFPLEMRAISISLFYAAGSALGGFLGPPLYGAMIESGSRSALFGAYAFAAVLMMVAAIVTMFLGVDAERKPLEEVCAPLGCDPKVGQTKPAP
ncbi:MAG: putative transporter, MSF-type [Rhodocyclales bacterium]|nr:putative transporter, MSF-type [Rhodocyclales bacterium]